MDEMGLLERPAVVPAAWTAPDAASEISAIRGLMLHRLCTLSHKMRSIAVKDVLREHDLDLRDWAVLAALADLGSGSQREITFSSNLDKVAVNRAATRLKDRGLLASRPNKDDGRSHLLQLTPYGVQTLSQCSKELAAFECKVLSGFSAFDTDEMSRLLEKLMDSLESSRIRQ